VELPLRDRCRYNVTAKRRIICDEQLRAMTETQDGRRTMTTVFALALIASVFVRSCQAAGRPCSHTECTNRETARLISVDALMAMKYRWSGDGRQNTGRQKPESLKLWRGSSALTGVWVERESLFSTNNKKTYKIILNISTVAGYQIGKPIKLVAYSINHIKSRAHDRLNVFRPTFLSLHVWPLTALCAVVGRW